MADPCTIASAKALDQKDSLACFRKEFVIDNPDLIYLDGNSLGRLPLKAAVSMEHAVNEQWGKRLIKSWNEGWYDLPIRLGNKIARLIGAREGEVIVSDSTSVNLYKLAYAALIASKGKTEIISDEMNFPSDLYIFQGLINKLGSQYSLHLVGSADGIKPEISELVRLINSRTALISLSHVAFKSSYLYDMKRITELAHRNDALVLWDLSHSAGAVKVDLNEAGADLAVGCTYKYLNGGPGSPAFLYVRKELQEELENPIQGWFGEQNPFEFQLGYRKAEGIRKFLAGTPPVVSLSGMESALDMILEAGIDRIREKSMAQSEYLLSLVRHFLSGQGIRVGSPERVEERGSHISLKHDEAYRICKALTDPEVGDGELIPDFREPDNIRLGISPLYTSYEDIFRAVSQIKEIISEKIYENYPLTREQVT